MSDEKDVFDILLDKIENLEKRLNDKKDDKTDKKDDKTDNGGDIDKAKVEAEKKEKQTIAEKLKEKMKNRGLL
jgi:hypothetical protein